MGADLDALPPSAQAHRATTHLFTTYEWIRFLVNSDSKGGNCGENGPACAVVPCSPTGLTGDSKLASRFVTPLSIFPYGYEKQRF